MSSCKKCNEPCRRCCEPQRMQPIPVVTAVTSDPTGIYLQPSGPATNTAVPHVHSDSSVTLELWDGTTWTTSPLVIPPGGIYNYSLSFVPPSSITPNYDGVTAGNVAEAWTNPQVSTVKNGVFAVSGVIAGIPTLALYSITLVTLSTIVLPGIPSLLAFDGKYAVIAGQVSAGVYFLAIYGVGTGNVLTLVKSYTYGVPVTSISLTLVDTATPGVTRNHTVLLVTTSAFYLPGEIIGVPAPVLTLATAPPGDLFLYELLPLGNPVYTTPPPALLFSYRYGGLLSAAYSRIKNCIFALNAGQTVVSFSAMWKKDGISVIPTPWSQYEPGATGVYVVDGVGFSDLLVYGAARVVAYVIKTIPF